MNDWYETLVDTPFTDDISMIDTLANFITPKFMFYYGTTDPRDHIIHYRQIMIPACILHRKRDAVMCKVFASSFMAQFASSR